MILENRPLRIALRPKEAEIALGVSSDELKSLVGLGKIAPPVSPAEGIWLFSVDALCASVEELCREQQDRAEMGEGFANPWGRQLQFRRQREPKGDCVTFHADLGREHVAFEIKRGTLVYVYSPNQQTSDFFRLYEEHIAEIEAAAQKKYLQNGPNGPKLIELTVEDLL